MKLVPYSVTRSIGRAVLKTQKNSPHILFAAGVAGVVTSTVLACKATLKVDKDLDLIKRDIQDVKSAAELAHTEDALYTERDYYRDLGHVYIKSAVRIGRLYGPSVIVGAASIGALTGSHVQLSRRNAALTATVTAISKAYDDYRARIREEIGEERERDIYLGLREEKDEKGKKVKVVDGTGYSPYARIFNEQIVNWHKDIEHNRIFLTVAQTYFNNKLKMNGHVLLNDVYDHLGFERTPQGCVVGWLYGGNGDDFVDFGMYDGIAAARFLNGMENSIILDFNVDGVIYEQI